PGVAAREGVAHELPLARRTVGVAVVLHGAADPAEQLARLARRARDAEAVGAAYQLAARQVEAREPDRVFEHRVGLADRADAAVGVVQDRKSTRLNSSHVAISYAVFCLKKKNMEELSKRLTILSTRECKRVLCNFEHA